VSDNRGASASIQATIHVRTPGQTGADWLAYADCTVNGIMGTACMTGTSVAAYGRTGTMAAYPVEQNTTLR
jgi:hypothetical protein